MLEAIMAIWPVLVVFGGIGVWALRVEGLVKMNKKELDHLQDRVDRQDNEIKERLAKIDGRLETIATSLERVIWRIPRPNPDDDRQD